jgi:hypothetical protein
MPLDQTANFQRAEITDGFPMAAEDDDVYFFGADEFPDPANGEYNLVIFDQTQFARPDQDPNVEIVRATSRLSSVELAVDRGQEGTSAADHPAGSAVILASTSKVFDDVAATDQPVENFTTNSSTPGEALTSDGNGGLAFNEVGTASILRDNEEISYVALNINDLPQPTGSGEQALIVSDNDYSTDTRTVSGLLDGYYSGGALTFNNVTPDNFTIGDDDRKVYVCDSSDPLLQYEMSTPGDITTESLEKNNTNIEGQDILFKPDGTKMYLSRNSNIRQYALSTAWDITTANQEHSASLVDDGAHGIDWDDTGTTLVSIHYARTSNYRTALNQFSLTTPYDISTMSFEKRATENDANFGGNSTSFTFNQDGTKGYALDYASNEPDGFEFGFSTPYDVGTIFSIRTNEPFNDEYPSGIAYNSDFTKGYLYGRENVSIWQDDLENLFWS